jgi:hypothetical protein
VLNALFVVFIINIVPQFAPLWCLRFVNNRYPLALLISHRLCLMGTSPFLNTKPIPLLRLVIALNLFCLLHFFFGKLFLVFQLSLNAANFTHFIIFLFVNFFFVPKSTFRSRFERLFLR